MKLYTGFHYLCFCRFLNPGHETINEKYDLKGSWVARNAKPPQDGQRVPCTYCNQTFVYKRSKPKGSKTKKKESFSTLAEEEKENGASNVMDKADR